MTQQRVNYNSELVKRSLSTPDGMSFSTGNIVVYVSILYESCLPSLNVILTRYSAGGKIRYSLNNIKLHANSLNYACAVDSLSL